MYSILKHVNTYEYNAYDDFSNKDVVRVYTSNIYVICL